MDLYFSKKGQKGHFKIVTQILVDEWISLTSFYCLSIIFSSLGKKCLIRAKTCRKIKYQIYEVISILVLNRGDTDKWSKKPIWITLYFKKIRHNFFNLSSGGNVTWIVNFLSDVLSSLANPTDHMQCESEEKSESEVFVTWPWNRSVIWLCARRSLNLSTYPAKFEGHRTCGWGNITFSNCHLTTELKCHVTFLGPIHDEYY